MNKTFYIIKRAPSAGHQYRALTPDGRAWYAKTVDQAARTSSLLTAGEWLIDACGRGGDKSAYLAAVAVEAPVVVVVEVPDNG